MNGKYITKKKFVTAVIALVAIMLSPLLTGCYAGGRSEAADRAKKEAAKAELTWVKVPGTNIYGTENIYKACLDGNLFFVFDKGSYVHVPDERNECIDGKADPVSTR